MARHDHRTRQQAPQYGAVGGRDCADALRLVCRYRRSAGAIGRRADHAKPRRLADGLCPIGLCLWHAGECGFLIGGSLAGALAIPRLRLAGGGGDAGTDNGGTGGGRGAAAPFYRRCGHGGGLSGWHEARRFLGQGGFGPADWAGGGRGDARFRAAPCAAIPGWGLGLARGLCRGRGAGGPWRGADPGVSAGAFAWRPAALSPGADAGSLAQQGATLGQSRLSWPYVGTLCHVGLDWRVPGRRAGKPCDWPLGFRRGGGRRLGLHPGGARG